MTPLTAIAIGATTGIGVLLIIAGLRGQRVLTSVSRLLPATARTETAVAWLAAALVTAVLVVTVTGWIVAAVAAAVLVWAAPLLGGASKQRDGDIARTEAIASWAEMIRDNMAGSAGLEQALLAATTVAPKPIALDLARFAARVERIPLVDALVRLGADLNHPSADLVVVSLVNASRMEARELGPLLGRLAEAIRGDVRMRLRVEVGRARIRTSARIVIATTSATMLFLFAFSRQLLAAYDSTMGQLWLCVVAAVFTLGAWLLRVYGRIDMPERFTARTDRIGARR